MPKKRKVSKKDVRAVFHIICEGEKTEPNYIDYYIKNYCRGRFGMQAHRIKLNKVFNIAKTNKTDPLSLVKVAIEAQCRLPQGDVFWCVYDREAENAISEKAHEKARIEAVCHDIKIALSSVCFEVWLLLHKQETCAHYISYEDLAKRSRLKSYYKNYQKGDRILFSDEEIDCARIRARKMNNITASSHPAKVPCCRLNPYTDFYLLLDDIDAFFKECCAY